MLIGSESGLVDSSMPIKMAHTDRGSRDYGMFQVLKLGLKFVVKLQRARSKMMQDKLST